MLQACFTQHFPAAMTELNSESFKRLVSTAHSVAQAINMLVIEPISVYKKIIKKKEIISLELLKLSATNSSDKMTAEVVMELDKEPTANPKMLL
jgi:hypothetical protein